VGAFGNKKDYTGAMKDSLAAVPLRKVTNRKEGVAGKKQEKSNPEN